MNLILHRRKLYEAFEYLIVCVLILDCRTLWQRLTNTPSWINVAFWGVLLVAVMGCILMKKRLKVAAVKKSLLYGIAAMLFFGLYVAVRPLNIMEVRFDTVENNFIGKKRSRCEKEAQKETS